MTPLYMYNSSVWQSDGKMQELWNTASLWSFYLLWIWIFLLETKNEMGIGWKLLTKQLFVCTNSYMNTLRNDLYVMFVCNSFFMKGKVLTTSKF